MKATATLVCTVLSASLVAASSTGCVTMPASTARFQDQSDPCYAQRQPLIQSERQLGQKMIAGALIGGIGAAGVAAATGQHRDTVLVSGVLGALAGATLGYYEGMAQKELTQQQMLGEIYGDATADARRLSQTRGLIGRLNQCRNRQIDTVEADFRAGRIRAEEVGNRLNVIKASVEMDNELIGTVLGHAHDRSRTYVDATQRASGLSEEVILGDVKRFQPTARIATAIPVGSGRPYVATRSSNVRAAPSTSAGVVGGLMVGQKVAVTAQQGDWMAVAFNNQTAYVHASLLAEEGSAAARTAVAAAAAPSAQLAVATPPRAANPVQAVAIETKLLEGEHTRDQQLILARINAMEMMPSRRGS